MKKKKVVLETYSQSWKTKHMGLQMLQERFKEMGASEENQTLTRDCRRYKKDSKRWELQRKTIHLRGTADVTRKIQGDRSFRGKVIL